MQSYSLRTLCFQNGGNYHFDSDFILPFGNYIACPATSANPVGSKDVPAAAATVRPAAQFPVVADPRSLLLLSASIRLSDKAGKIDNDRELLPPFSTREAENWVEVGPRPGPCFNGPKSPLAVPMQAPIPPWAKESFAGIQHLRSQQLSSAVLRGSRGSIAAGGAGLGQVGRLQRARKGSIGEAIGRHDRRR
jgi:hypothetical protein